MKCLLAALLLTTSCSTFWSSAADVGGSAAAPAVGAAIGSSLGPAGAFAGAVVGDLIDQTITSKVEVGDAQEATQVAQAQTTSQLSGILMELTGNPEAAAYFRKQAIAVAEEEAGSVFWLLIKLVGAAIAVFAVIYIWREWLWVKKDQAAEERVEQNPYAS